MRIFLDLAREIRALREEIEPMLEDVYGSFSVARAVMTPEMLEEALMYPKQSVKLDNFQNRHTAANNPVLIGQIKGNNTILIDLGCAEIGRASCRERV